MTDFMKRSLALLVVLVLCLSLLPATLVAADAANVEYVYDSTGKYIYNWGTRGTKATFLSPNADAFYTGSNTYAALSTLAGGTGTADAPNSALYAALQKLMKDAHKTETSYEATKNLYQYTDCQNNGGKISSFYSGLEIGPTWDGSFNREHTWPNSKGLAGNDENDIMMLRPTSTVENSARGNTAYGQSGGYYNPNSESDGTLDLRGDVARIFLYVYVRWGNVNGNGKYTTWGTQGVMESLDVLLLWMELDPVDTWELGRNDSVQSITGTRNVFVDYPEFAFLLFGADMPALMSTPSGEAAGAVSCQHNYVAGTPVPATCTTDGYTVYTCSLCSRSYQGDKVPAGHKFVSGTCTVCGAGEYGVIENPVAGTPYKFGMVQKNVSATNVYYLIGGMSGTYYFATGTDKNAALDVYLEQTTGGYYLYTYINGAKTYINMVVSGTHVNGVYQSSASTVYTYDTTNKTVIAEVNGEPYWFGTRNDKNYTTVGPCALSYNGFYCQFYGEATQGEEPAPSCEHKNTTVTGAKDATCTEKGHTGKTVCDDCGQTVDFGKAIDALGHNFAGGVCTVCGEAKPANETVTISFANKAQRTEYSTSKQVWEQNGITVTNLKAASTSNVGDYANPARFYASSSLKIEYPGMTKIEFTCGSSSYATVLKNSIGAAATASGSKVTVTFAEPQDSFSVAKLSAQVRVSSITITALPGCEHINTSVEGAKDVTCTEDGHTGKTVCDDCGETVDAGSVIETQGHNYVNHICSVCGAVDADAPKYNVYFLVPDGVNKVAPMVCGPEGITLPTAGTVDGYTFLGWVTGVVNNVTDKPEYMKAGDNYLTEKDIVLYALYSYEQEGEGGGAATSGTANISFANKAQRTAFDSSKQIWVQNGITVTNLKAASTSPVADYANPARFYANSSLEIAHPGMTKIVFTCDASKYATALKNSIGSTATVSGSTVTVNFAAPQDSLKIAKLTAQVRVRSMAVTYSVVTSAEPVTYYTTVIGDACGHAKTEFADKDATCTEAGYKGALICTDCKTVLVAGETVKALDHDLIQHEAKAPNCTENGWKAYETCSRCDHTTYEEIPSNGHNHEAVVTEPTCTEGGYTTYTCAGCGDSYVADEVDALDHDLIQHEGKDATCGEIGWDAYETCSRCDHTTYKENPSNGHDLIQHEAKAPSCTENGWKAYETCSRCDHTTYEEIPSNGHNHEAVVTDPTCTEGGYTTYTCADCGDSYVADEVDSLGHNIIHVEAKEATVDEEGNIEYWYCETCREVWTDEACTEATTWEDVVLPKKDAPDVPPQTGDNELFVLMGAMTAVSMLAVVVLLKKKNYIFAQ